MSKWVRPSADEVDEMRRAEEVQSAARAREAETRRHVRLAMHANVTMQSETNFVAGLSENISEGGIFVSTFSPPNIGERVALKITVDGGGSVMVEGVVRWLRHDDTGGFSGCGIQFMDLSPQASKAIDGLVTRLPREPLLGDF